MPVPTPTAESFPGQAAADSLLLVLTWRGEGIQLVPWGVRGLSAGTCEFLPPFLGSISTSQMTSLMDSAQGQCHLGPDDFLLKLLSQTHLASPGSGLLPASDVNPKCFQTLPDAP